MESNGNVVRCLFPDVANRILFELAKLSKEVKQLRQLMMRQTNIQHGVTEECVIPEIRDGPVNTVEECHALFNAAVEKKAQDYLVNVTMLHALDLTNVFPKILF